MVSNTLWVLFGLVVAATADDGKHWSYHGKYDAAHWVELQPLCSESSPRQSPIDIVLNKTVFNEDLEAIHLNEKIDQTYTSMKVVNNGHSVNLGVPHPAYITGGAYAKGSHYRIAGVHFHWGSKDSVGSEHTVQKGHFPLEMHMVSYDTAAHETLGDAVFGSNSLAVLGTMFQISPKNNTILDPLIKGLRSVRVAGSDGEIEHFNIGRLLPAHTNKYFRYLGSLTTPPCAESVVWTLFLHTQTISSAQLLEFRQLLEADHGEDAGTGYIVDNWRPAQPLHGRSVARSFLLKSELSHEAQAAHSAAPTVGPTLTILAICNVILYSIY